MGRLPGVLLGDLQLHHRVRVRERAEQRMRGLADLEVDRAVLDLHDGVGGELAVQRRERLVGLVRPLQRVEVVHERAPHDDAVVGLHCRGQHVRAVGVGAAVRDRSRLPFGVGLDEEAAEVGDRRVDLVRLVLPPLLDARVERVGGGESAEEDRAGEVHRHVHRDAPLAQDAGEGCELGQHLGGDELRVGVDVVDHGAVDADRGERAGVRLVAGPELGELVPEEDGVAGVPALDAAVEVVPVVGEPQLVDGALADVGFVQAGLGLYEPEEMEGAVQRASIAVTGDENRVEPVDLLALDRVALFAEVTELGAVGVLGDEARRVRRADDDRPVAVQGRLQWCVAAEHRLQRGGELGRGALHDRVAGRWGDDVREHALVRAALRGVVDERVAEPQVRAVLVGQSCIGQRDAHV